MGNHTPASCAWSTSVASSPRQARRTWHVIGTNTAGVWRSRAVKALSAQISAARKRGAKSEVERLIKEQEDMCKSQEAAIYEHLQRQGLNAGLIDFHRKLSAIEFTNRTARTALERQLAAKFGQTTNAPGSQMFIPRHGTVSGFASHQGLLVELHWLSFPDISTSLPSLLDWLCRQQCSNVKYDIASTAQDTDDFTE